MLCVSKLISVDYIFLYKNIRIRIFAFGIIIFVFMYILVDIRFVLTTIFHNFILYKLIEKLHNNYETLKYYIQRPTVHLKYFVYMPCVYAELMIET